LSQKIEKKKNNNKKRNKLPVGLALVDFSKVSL
jgi:hypothetical protein